MRILKSNPVTDETRIRARELRKNSTMLEKRLWHALRNHQSGVKFRRQVPIESYIVDFYSPSLGLVIEIDGDTHAADEAIEYDRTRDGFLRAQGLKVKRYTNREIMNNLDGVLADLLQMIDGSQN
ncbi:MAG: endonuclease domain-containing protein [bacterium]|nr:endonuclease domain-containing protein [bacterium]